MNKLGFTLVELLAVIALVAILSGMAVVSTVSSINNSRRAAFLMDAKRMISKAEYLIAESREDRNIAKSTSKIYTLQDLNEKGEFLKDADGGEFDSSSFVKVTFNGTSYEYCICLIGSSRNIKSGDICDSTNGNGCVISTTLTSIDKVNDNLEN